MSDTAAKKKIRLRRNIVRAALILVYLGLMVLVFVQGKGHTILIDNKDSGSFAALEGVRVAVDRQADSEYAAGDRDMAKVVGQVHRVVIDRQDGSAKIEKTIRLPLGADTVLLSLPKLVAGAEPYLEPFQVKVSAPADEEAPAAEGATLEGPAPAAPSTEASSTSSEDSGEAVFYSEPGGQGTATTDSSSKDATSSEDSDGAVFYSEPGGQGTESH